MNRVRIGIFVKSIKDYEEIKELDAMVIDLIKNNKETITKEIKNFNHYYIETENCSYQIVRSCENSKGRAFHKIYVDHRITDVDALRMINNCLKPYLTRDFKYIEYDKGNNLIIF